MLKLMFVAHRPTIEGGPDGTLDQQLRNVLKAEPDIAVTVVAPGPAKR